MSVLELGWLSVDINQQKYKGIANCSYNIVSHVYIVYSDLTNIPPIMQVH